MELNTREEGRRALELICAFWGIPCTASSITYELKAIHTALEVMGKHGEKPSVESIVCRVLCDIVEYIDGRWGLEAVL